MNIRIIVPAIHRQLTGGNVFNQRIINYLSRVADTDVTIFALNNDMPYPQRNNNEFNDYDFTIVDSLLLREKGFFEFLSKNEYLGKVILLVHYLHLLDPLKRESIETEKERNGMTLFDGFIVVSEYAKKVLIDAGIEAYNISMVLSGVDDDYTKDMYTKVQNEIPKMLTVANFFKEKGLLEFIEILERIKEVEWEWNVVGSMKLDPKYAKKFLQRLDMSPVKDRIQLHHVLLPASVRKMYDQCDVFILPSLFDNSPLVVREAMSRGLPVAAYAVGGIPEIIADGVSGVLISPGDSTGFVSALAEMIKNDTVRQHMGKAALNKSKKFHSWEDAGEKVFNVLKTIKDRE